MKKNEQTPSEISKFFLSEDTQSDLADFLACTADEIEGIVSAFEDVDLEEFDNLDDEEKESILISGSLWYAANITVDEVYQLLDECEQVVADYRRLSAALRKWKHGEPNPLIDSNLVSSFHWIQRKSKEGNIYELQHEDINLLSNYMMEDLFPYFGEAYFTKEARDYINETIH